MLRSRISQAVVIGCLAALATWCALAARAGDTYSIVAQSTPATAATGRRPLAERIASANLPITARAAVDEAPQPQAARGDEAVSQVAAATPAVAAPAPAASRAAGAHRGTAPLRMPARTAARLNPSRR